VRAYDAETGKLVLNFDTILKNSVGVLRGSESAALCHILAFKSERVGKFSLLWGLIALLAPRFCVMKRHGHND
jgi:hypothetical protein